MKTFLRVALIASLCMPAFAQVAQMPNPVPICTESQACVITAVSDPNARFQFGAGTTWCPTFNTPALPLTVLSGTAALCGFDPAPNMNKTLAAQQRNTTYFVTYALDGQIQPVKTILGLLATPKIVASFNCTISVYSDGTFQSSNCSAVKW